MKAIILAAGRGSRMKNLTNKRPKCLVKLQNKPLIEWQLEALRKAGINDVAIVTGYKREMLAEYNLIEFNNPEWNNTQMVSSLECASDWLNNHSCIVSYSDIVFEASAVKLLYDEKSSLSILYDKNWLVSWSRRFENPLDDAETFKIDSLGKLTGIGDTAKSLSEIDGQYMGLLKFTPKAWHAIAQFRGSLSDNVASKMHMTGLLNSLVTKKIIGVSGIPYSGQWAEIDSEFDLKCAEGITL